MVQKEGVEHSDQSVRLVRIDLNYSIQVLFDSSFQHCDRTKRRGEISFRVLVFYVILCCLILWDVETFTKRLEVTSIVKVIFYESIVAEVILEHRGD